MANFSTSGFLRQFPESGIFSDTDKQQPDYLQPGNPPISGQNVLVTHTHHPSHLPGTKGPCQQATGKKGWNPWGVRLAASTQGGRHYHGVIGEGVGVIDPLSGAVPVSWLPGAGKGWNDLIVVLTAEQLSLSRI